MRTRNSFFDVVSFLKNVPPAFWMQVLDLRNSVEAVRYAANRVEVGQAGYQGPERGCERLERGRGSQHSGRKLSLVGVEDVHCPFNVP